MDGFKAKGHGHTHCWGGGAPIPILTKQLVYTHGVYTHGVYTHGVGDRPLPQLRMTRMAPPGQPEPPPPWSEHFRRKPSDGTLLFEGSLWVSLKGHQVERLNLYTYIYIYIWGEFPILTEAAQRRQPDGDGFE